MNQTTLRPLLPLLLLFVATNGFFIISQDWLAKKMIDTNVVILGNLIIVGVCLLSFFFTKRSLPSKNPHVFVRAVYSGFIIKFFILALSASIYIMLVDQINKPALFVCMGLYLIYTFLEVSALLRLLKQKKTDA